MDYIQEPGSELVIAIVGALGVDHTKIISALENRFKHYDYQSDVIKISREVIPALAKKAVPEGNYERAKFLIEEGDSLRRSYGDNSILALGSLNEIHSKRLASKGLEYEVDAGDIVYMDKKVHIISSLKRPEEVNCLRNVYSRGVYLIGVYAEPERRAKRLIDENGGMTPEQAEELIKIDEKELDEYGQRTRDTFHLADFFVSDAGDEDLFKAQINRIVDLMYGAPFETPTFDEYAMFHAFSASLRSADLSRQVGAVIAKNKDIISMGANDCPMPGGGLFWREINEKKQYSDQKGGRDYTLGKDMNADVRQQLFKEVAEHLKKAQEEDFDDKPIMEALRKSGLNDITEYGRMVHAEMEALLSCSRNNISCREATIYATTFPCHNCAKHIIASGIKEIVYVEPYPKSRTLEFYGKQPAYEGKIVFRPFIGVGPRQFFNLFSMHLSAGGAIKRKNADGKKVILQPKKTIPRIAIRPYTYIHIEKSIYESFQKEKSEESKRGAGNSSGTD